MRFVTWLRSLAPRPASPLPRRARLSLEPLEERAVPSAGHDVLYIGDQGNANADTNTVQEFDAATGAPLGTLVAPNAAGLHGPRGMVFRNPGQLLVVNQNQSPPSGIPGEILRYNGRTGDPLGALVPSDDPNAPDVPRGMVLRDHVLYVGNIADALSPDIIPGEVDRYDADSGKFLGKLVPANFPGPFEPRGVVFGPDGGLYVSSFDATNGKVGYVVRFDTASGASQIIASNNGDGIDQPGELKDLHRPEGLAFGPDGRLYVTSFQADGSDIDRILVLDPTTGAEVKSIALDAVGQSRTYAEAILFGPGGRLFAPITTTGEVRSYDVSDGSFGPFVPAGTTLGRPWYLTFGQTDPATLAYGMPDDFSPELVNALLSLQKGHDQGVAP
jgi:DNA-binding beta-propeller fold protein YncE